MPLVRGPALAMKARPGGKAQHDTIDAPTIALRRRGGRRPPAAVSPAAMRATRDWRRRRRPLARTRGALLAQGPQPHRHDTWPALGPQIAPNATRDGGAARFADPAVPKRRALARARLGSDEAWRRARALVKAARPHAAHTRSLLRTGPGLGQMLRRGWLDAMHARARVPRGQAVAAYGRRGTCAKDAAGQRDGPSGTKLGQAPLTWAFAEAAV
jgi:hypothetical protein